MTSQPGSQTNNRNKHIDKYLKNKGNQAIKFRVSQCGGRHPSHGFRKNHTKVDTYPLGY